VSLVAPVALLWPSEREPVYQGQSLSQWLHHFLPSGFETADSVKAGIAVNRLGTNALPCLLRWVQYDCPAWKKQLRWFIRLTLPKRMADRGFVFRVCCCATEEMRAENAAAAFQFLGLEGKTAIPELTRVSRNHKALWASRRALRALMYVGDDAIPALVAELRDRASPNRLIAAGALGVIAASGTNGPWAAWSPDEALEAALHPEDFGVMEETIVAWSRCGVTPAVAVPALANSLRQARNVSRPAAVTFRAETALVLIDLGKAASPAVPALLDLTADSEGRVRSAATNALRTIAPEVLEQAAKPGNQDLRQKN
jgi:hypothetical protein